MSPADFPPWVCERFTSLKESSSPTGEGAITLAVPRACELILGGRSLGQGLLFPNIVPGVKIVQVRCGDHLSPVQEVVVAKGGIRYHPLIFTASRLGESNEVTLVANGRADQEGIVSDILLLGGKTGHHRLVAVVGTNDGLAVWLVDDRLKRVIRENRALTGDSEGAKRAAEALVPASQERGFADAPLAKQPWYRNAAAWTLVGSGAALLGTGIVLYAQHGSPSQLMPVTLALLASGAGIAGTGVVLFFFPALRSRDASASSAGITAGLSMGRSF